MKLDRNDLKNKIDAFLASDAGTAIYNVLTNTLDEYNMRAHIARGVLLGFSGGSDSVLLSLILKKLSYDTPFSLCLMHVNHKIRGAEAESDAEFCRSFADALDVPFSLVEIDVPSLSERTGKGIEECARDARYGAFSSFMREHPEYATVATAHNATDNLETVIFNLMRDSGTKGASGIAPVRDNVVRPIIALPKAEIASALDTFGIPYVTDSTNASTEYTRNYIRHEILPGLQRLSPCPEASAKRASDNLRLDDEYISGVADRFVSEKATEAGISSSALAELHPAVFSRVLRKLLSDSGASVEKVHVDKIHDLLKKGRDFASDVPGGLRVISCAGVLSVIRKCEIDTTENKIPKTLLKNGVTVIEEADIAILLSEDKHEVYSSNVYKFEIQAEISSAIIDGDLFVRSKEDADSYFYGGMKRKLKKLFNDKKISPKERWAVPVICDEKGIVWVAGFGVRSSDSIASAKRLWLSLYKKHTGETK